MFLFLGLQDNDVDGKRDFQEGELGMDGSGVSAEL